MTPMPYGLVCLAQEWVAAHNPNPYYSTYRKHELNYWAPIAGWLGQLPPEERFGKEAWDVGCAYGTLMVLCYLLGFKVVGVDERYYICPELLIKLRSYLWQASIEWAAIPDESADVIIFTEILEHLNSQPLPTIRKLYTCLKPGGRLYLSTPNAEIWGVNHKYYKSLAELPAYDPALPVIDDHIWHYTPEQVTDLLHESGFEITQLVVGRHIVLEAKKRI